MTIRLREDTAGAVDIIPENTKARIWYNLQTALLSKLLSKKLSVYDIVHDLRYYPKYWIIGVMVGI